MGLKGRFWWEERIADTSWIRAQCCCWCIEIEKNVEEEGDKGDEGGSAGADSDGRGAGGVFAGRCKEVVVVVAVVVAAGMCGGGDFAATVVVVATIADDDGGGEW